MDVNALTDNSEFLVALSAGISVFAAIMVVLWPYLTRDQLGPRMTAVLAERERIRARERARLQSPGPVSLRTEPKRLYRQIVDRFNLAKQAEDGSIAQKLRMAGYRGQGPVVTFLAIRLIAPFAMFAIAVFYVMVVLQLQHPLIVQLAIGAAVAVIGYYAPLLYVKNKIANRQKAIGRAWPDALELLLICVESGMGVESAFRKVSEEIGTQSGALAEELSLTTAELAYLQDRRKAYENLGERTGLDVVRSVVTSLIQAEKYGTPLGQALRVLAQENRDMRMAEAEKKAAALPPKLTVPMIIFFLPVLFAVIAGPAAIQIFFM